MSLSTPASAQLRQHRGRFVTLHTDLPDSQAIKELPMAFDAAVPQWCDFLNVDDSRVADWHVDAYLMSTKQAFAQRGLIPDELPNFAHGYQWGDSVWVVNQPSDYYTRHLLLHEGVHAVMARFFGAAGPAWYMEGTAELLATHHWSDGKMQANWIPKSRDVVPYWGRTKVIREGFEANKALPFDAIMRYSQKAHRQVEPYAWSWAALVLLDMYPEYRTVAVKSARRGTMAPTPFTRELFKDLREQWPVLQLRWLMLIEGLDYGFDRQRNRIEIDQPPIAMEASRQFKVLADRGWQSTRLRLTAGQKVRITATGTYTLGNDPKPWTCEPPGVTIDYYRGRPLGMLLAAVVPDTDGGAASVQLPQIVGVGEEMEFQSEHDGLLLLRIGDDPSKLADNQGSVAVTVSPVRVR